MISIKTRILAVSSNPNWFTNVCFLHNNDHYEIFSSLNGRNALELFKFHQPDILLLDKNLSDMNAIFIYEEIFAMDKYNLPIVIIIAKNLENHEIREYMDIGVDDFITLSSINKLPNIIQTQVTKRKRILLNNLISNQNELSKKDAIDLEITKQSANFNDYLFLDDKESPGFYAIKDFIYIKSLKDYSQIYTTSKKIITLHKTLNFWEGFLPNNKFIRIHRQTIINLDHVEKVESSNSYRYNIFLNNVGTPFVISQRYSQKIKNCWGIKMVK